MVDSAAILVFHIVAFLVITCNYASILRVIRKLVPTGSEIIQQGRVVRKVSCTTMFSLMTFFQKK